MKIKRKLGIVSLALALLFVLPFISADVNTNVMASDNLQVMTTGAGNTLYYRNSSEKVYMLKEYDYPTAEYRAVWVSTFVGDIPRYTSEEKFKTDATALLDNLVRMGMNAMVFHVRTHNNALYNSDLNPIASWWQTVDFDTFDPLTWLIDETHKRGIEFHAWMNPYRITDGYVGEAYPTGHPCLDSSQVLTNSSGSKILDPGSTRVQDFIVDTCMEFLDRYDADAIHFDDYFYISGVATDLDADQKRANVDAFIKKLSDKMHEMNLEEGRAVQLGISPSGIYQNGGYTSSPKYDANGNLTSPIASNTSGNAHYGAHLYSDTKKWIDEEWIDYITPQTYWAIEHTAASFVELSRWWSWAVRYKKVNLYLGMGIYMADESGTSATYWRKNPNEIKNQILNSGQYDEVKGICYYKYSYLSSQTSYIKNGVDLITNDYYAKRIPGAVIQRYASTTPSIKVSNLTLTNGTLSWDKIDNVFGYMVYQVPKGQVLDTNNIDHVLVYTQDTEVENINTIQYDYYVSSVNRANVKSTPVQYGAVVLKDYEEVIEAINSLPSTISLENESQIVSIRNKYVSLSDESKEKVTNIQVLINAEATINALKQLKERATTFISSINKRINTSRILPVENNMKWSYVNPNDASKYNISTGKRLINYIGSMPIELYLEVTDGTYTHKEKVEFNLCMLQESQIGLYYRNDPSSLSEHHIGEHTGATSFIGWSEATMTLGNYVLFIAKYNYHELTSSKIPSCNWTSCGGAYVNKSTSNITMTLSQAFSTESPTYGYLIIGANNQVKKVSTSSPGTESVTLLPNESLYIVRYLDRLLNDTPFTAVGNILVGTSAYISKYTEIETTAKDEGDAVVALINTLPASISLNDEALVISIQDAYNALSTEAKTYVTNLNVLNDAISRIEELKQELELKKQNSINELKNYPNINNYSVENQIIINDYINDATTKINKATTLEAINNLVVTCKSSIDNVPTIQEELIEYKATTLETYLKTVDLTKYNEQNQGLINGYIEDLKATVNLATSKIEVDQAIDNIKSKIANLKTIEEELEIYRTNLKNEISNYSSDKSYSSFNQDKVDIIIYDACTALNNATSIEMMDKIINDAKLAIDAIPTKDEELIEIKANAIIELNEYVTTFVQNVEEIIGLVDLVKQKESEINVQNSATKINSTLANAKSELYIYFINVKADEHVASLKELYPLTDYDNEEQKQVNSIINSIKDGITVNTTTDNLGKKAEEIKQQLNLIPTSKDKIDARIEEVRIYLDSLLEEDLTDSQLQKVQALIAEKNSALDNAKTLAEVEGIYEDSINEFSVILVQKEPSTTPSTDCTFTSVKQILTLTSILGLVVVLLRKRK